MWQDILFMVGNFILGAALIPTILAKEKPSKLTSSLTGVILLSYGAAFTTLGLYLAAIAVVVNATMWLVLLGQKWRKHARTPSKCFIPYRYCLSSYRSSNPDIQDIPDS